MARVTGIEITDSSVRICELDGSPKRIRVLGAASVPLSESTDADERMADLVSAIKAGLKAVRPNRTQVVLGLPARDAVIREIVVPFKDPDQIRKVIKFESESHLPVTNVDDVVVAFYKVEEIGPRSRLLIFAIPKATIRWHMRALSKAGIEPTQVDLAPAGIFNFALLNKEFLADEDDTSIQVILELGERGSHILITQGSRLRMARSLHLGSESLTRSISKDLGVERDVAQTMTQELMRPDLPFASEGDTAAAATSTALTKRTGTLVTTELNFARRLANEVRRTLSSIQMEGKVSRLWLCGVGSTAPAIERELASSMSVPVQHLMPLDGTDHRLDSDANLFVGPSLGLALKAMEHDSLGLEFRQEEFRYARKFDRIRNPLLILGLLALVLFLFLTILEVNRINNAKDSLSFVAKQAQNQFDLLLARNGKFYRYMGFKDADEARTILEQASRREPLALIRELRRVAERPLDHIRLEYGIDPYSPEAGSLDQVAVSGLTRLNQWFSVMKEAIPELGWTQVTALTTSSEKVTWTMRIPSDQENPLEVLDRKFSQLQGFVKFDPGTQKGEGNELVYTNSTLEFVTER
jgi:type IV pilus assembly protein PilM